MADRRKYRIFFHHGTAEAMRKKQNGITYGHRRNSVQFSKLLDQSVADAMHQEMMRGVNWAYKYSPWSKQPCSSAACTCSYVYFRYACDRDRYDDNISYIFDYVLSEYMHKVVIDRDINLDERWNAEQDFEKKYGTNAFFDVYDCQNHNYLYWFVDEAAAVEFKLSYF